MDYCNNCGSDIVQGSSSCKYCGANIPDYAERDQRRYGQHQRDYKYAPTDRSRGYSPYRPEPKTWLPEAILVTLFCCMPFGIVAIVKAASVSSRREAGDWEGAWRESAEAKKWTTWSLLSGLAVIALYIAAYIVILVLGIKHSSLF